MEINFLLPLFAFIFGLGVGSFINVAILRGAKGEHLGGRSRCETCKNVLSPVELIPVISFFLQKGRCKTCGSRISWQYPLLELGTAILFAAAAWLFTVGLISPIVLIGLATGIAASIVILVSDLRFTIIPNGAVLTLVVLGILVIGWRTHIDGYKFAWNTLVFDVVSSLGLALILAALWFFSKGRWMGLGDAKLVFATSLISGYPLNIVAFIFSFWIGSVIGILLVLLRIKTLRQSIPFGPYILAGTISAYLLRNQITAFWIF